VAFCNKPVFTKWWVSRIMRASQIFKDFSDENSSRTPRR
jgi:hypothetical protein